VRGDDFFAFGRLLVAHGCFFCIIRDLSLENIMFDKAGTVKIIDLGMCVRVPESIHSGPVLQHPQSRRGKPTYVCPEVAHEEVFNGYAADVWSLGIIIYMLLTLTPLYHSPEDRAFRMLVGGQFDALLDSYEKHGVVVSPQARDLLSGMLHPDFRRRLTLEEVLEHPWVRGAGLGDEEHECIMMSRGASE
jgi:serine/threonine protein kinase